MLTRYIDNIVPGRFGLFNSELNNTRYAANNNCELIITLKVYLRPKNEGRRTIRDSDRNRFRIHNWPPTAWRAFTGTYQSTGQNFWDNKFWLRTPAEYSDLNYDAGDTRSERIVRTHTERIETCHAYVFCSTETRTYEESISVRRGILRRRNLNCRFRLELVNSAAEAHTVIDVYYITHRQSRGRWIPIRGGDLTHYRSDASTYSSSDLVEEEMEFEGHTISFQTHIHEIGHAIGLEHSSVARREPLCINRINVEGMGEGSNSMLCYGNTLESAGDVMGMGMHLTWHDALPWRVAVERHTGINKDHWEITQTPIPPSL